MQAATTLYHGGHQYRTTQTAATSYYGGRQFRKLAATSYDSHDKHLTQIAKYDVHVTMIPCNLSNFLQEPSK